MSVAARDPGRPLPLLRGARGVFDVALEGMVWTRRSLLLVLLMGLPVAFALLYRALLAGRMKAGLSGFELYGLVVTVYYVRNVLPLAALFYASALVADEVEGKTLTYLLTRPLRRGSILLGKFGAYLVTALALALPATVVSYALLTTAQGLPGLSAGATDLVRDLGVMALALLAYGGLFTLMGVVLRRPVIPGLFFVFGWELLANLPGYMPRFTITAYLRSLLRHRPAEEGLAGMFGDVLPAALCLGVLAAATAAFLALSLWIFSRREYVMEQ